MAALTYNVTHFPAPDFNVSVVYVADSVAEAESPDLAALVAREAGLGDLRGCPSVREGGSNPGVDLLYEKLNRKIVEVKTRIARRVLTALGPTPARLADRASFDVNAGYGPGVRNPGVVVPGLRLGGRIVEIIVN